MRPEEPLPAGSFSANSCVAGTKHRSTLRVCPGSSAVRPLVFVRFFFRTHLHAFPQTGIFQYPSDRVRTDQGNPAIGFGQFVRNPFHAPIGLRLFQVDHLLLGFGRGPVRVFRPPDGKRYQSGVAILVKAWLPIIKRPTPDMGCATGLGHVAGRFPGFEQQFALLPSCFRKIGSFGIRAAMILPLESC